MQVVHSEGLCCGSYLPICQGARPDANSNKSREFVNACVIARAFERHSVECTDARRESRFNKSLQV